MTVVTSLLRPCGYERFVRMVKIDELTALTGECTVDVEAIHVLNESQPDH